MIDYLLFALMPVVVLLFMLGQGWLALRWSGCANRPLTSFGDLALWLAATLAAGILVNYILVLAFKSISFSLIAGGILASAGLIFALARDRANLFASLQFSRSDLARALFLILMFFLVFIPIMALPLYDWDARSIWFFHGKMMYYAGTLGPEAGWNIQTAQFSHVDYPKLVPAMAAQLTTAAGYWNEYLPKASLLALLAPVVLVLSAKIKRDLPSLFLILLLVIVIDDELWNGYMDGYLAIYAGLTLLAFSRYYQSGERHDLVRFIAFLGMMPALKNEGILAALIVTVLGSFLIWRRRERLAWSRWHVVALLFIILVILPTTLWQADRMQMGLRNDLALGSQNSITQLSTRLTDGSVGFILKSVLVQTDVSLFILTIMLFFCIYRRKTLDMPATLAILTGLAYLAGMVAVYMMTPHDVNWHVDSSVNRTMFTVNTCFFVAAYLIMKSADEPAQNPLDHHARDI